MPIGHTEMKAVLAAHLSFRQISTVFREFEICTSSEWLLITMTQSTSHAWLEHIFCDHWNDVKLLIRGLFLTLLRMIKSNKSESLLDLSPIKGEYIILSLSTRCLSWSYDLLDSLIFILTALCLPYFQRKFEHMKLICIRIIFRRVQMQFRGSM